MGNQKRNTRRNYDRAATTDDEPGPNDDPPTDNTDDAGDTIQIQILDSAQNKFTIPSVAPTTCTVQRLKDIGHAIHGVPPPQQRLIYMGKLLNDETARLDHYGIEKDMAIVHLFPKPTVVIDRSGGGGGEDTSLCSPSSANDGENDGETAHIPQIILDASEAERHSSVIILSSHEAFEILHRVRLCAFCLLVYSSMELLQDLTLWMGKNIGDGGLDCDSYDSNSPCHIRPDEPTDTTDPGIGDEMVEWESWNYFDVLISIFSFYVSMLGIKVTTEHERKTARLFWNLLVLLAVTWNGFYYWNLVRQIEDERDKQDAKRNGNDGDNSNDANGQDDRDPSIVEMSPYNLALWYMSFLFLLWFVFLFWARQFKNLMEEAGAEAEERTQNLTNGTTLNATGYGGADSMTSDSASSVTNDGSDSNRGGVYDLELQVERREIT